MLSICGVLVFGVFAPQRIHHHCESVLENVVTFGSVVYEGMMVASLVSAEEKQLMIFLVNDVLVVRHSRHHLSLNLVVVMMVSSYHQMVWVEGKELVLEQFVLV